MFLETRLGAVHDGSPPPSYLGGPGAEKCRWEDGFIMSDLRHTEKGFKWSPCSVASFHHFLKYTHRLHTLWNLPFFLGMFSTVLSANFFPYARCCSVYSNKFTLLHKININLENILYKWQSWKVKLIKGNFPQVYLMNTQNDNIFAQIFQYI